MNRRNLRPVISTNYSDAGATLVAAIATVLETLTDGSQNGVLANSVLSSRRE